MERDDLINDHQYSLNAIHSEEEGKKSRRNIIKVTIILSIITALEVGFGIIKPKADFDITGFAWKSVIAFYVILTLIKAFYIVMVFMHLGHEQKWMRKLILIPYLIFICYVVILYIIEGLYLFNVMWGKPLV